MPLSARKSKPVSDPVAEEVLQGLAKTPRRIAPKFFYDQKGSVLFDAITELDEYYIPRVERAIFAEHARAICAAIGTGKTVIEPGAGSCEKIKWLLPELRPAVYVPMDISAEHLRTSVEALQNDYPKLNVAPRICDHTAGIELNGYLLSGAAQVFFYPGSSIGNFEPRAVIEFLRDMRAQMQGAGGLLIGVDTKKDRKILNAAYNDSQGVTANFNLNILNHLNSLLDGDLSTDNFEHLACYNEDEGRIEMHLKCTRAHTASLAGEKLEFAAGELVHTENSYKYRPDEFATLAARAGFRRSHLWQDARGWFAVMYFVPA